MANVTGVARAVVHTPGIVGGSARLDGTRIPVWILANWADQGWSVAEIQESYPRLTIDDVVAALAYARANRAEIEEEYRRQDSDDEE